MSTISFGGLASGMDTGAIIEALLEVRRQPIVNLQSRIKLYENQQKALTELEGKVKAMLTAAQELDTPEEFASIAAVSSHEDLLSATASHLAMPGSFSITVNSLATAQKDISQGYDSLLSSVGTGDIAITVGGETTTVSLAAGADSLSDLRDAINASGAGVSANILFDGSATGGYHLVVSATETGIDNAFTLDASGLAGGDGLTLTNVAGAADAVLTIDSLTVTSATNTVSTAIQGVTLDLHAADEGQTILLDLATDPEAVQEKMQAFVDSYNDLFTYIQEQKAEGATLRGHAMVRDVQQRVSSMVSGRLPAGGELSLLYQAGVRQGEGGLLTFDTAVFQEAIGNDYGAVRNLVAGTTAADGKADQLVQLLESLTDSTDGLFKISADGLTDRIEKAEDTIERYEISVDNYESLLNRKFTALESLINGYNAQGSYLSSYLSAG